MVEQPYRRLVRMTKILDENDPHTEPSFGFRNRLTRTLWKLFCFFLFRYTPRSFHQWRSLVLKLFGADLGKDCHVYPKAKIWAPWNLKMYGASCLANHVTCYNIERVSIGYRSVISQGTHLCTGSHDYSHPKFTLIAKPITIGPEVWIAAECFVGPGVTIGDNAVIGARSVVTEDIPDGMVCAGNPCRPIKKREGFGEAK